SRPLCAARAVHRQRSCARGSPPGGAGGTRTHTLRFLSRAPPAVGLRPLLILELTCECRSLGVAIWTKKAEVSLPVVQPVPVDVIHIQYYRLAVPLGVDATCRAGVGHASLA